MGLTDEGRCAAAPASRATDISCFFTVTASFSLFYAVCVAFFYSVWLFGLPGNPVGAFDAALNPAIAVACGGVTLSAALRPGVRRLPFLTAGYACLALALAGVFALVALDAPTWCVPLAGALAGVGMGCATPFYFEALAGFSRRHKALGCAVMSLAGMVLAMLVELLPARVGPWCCLVLLAGSAACLAWSGAGRRVGRADAAAPGASDAVCPAYAASSGTPGGTRPVADLLSELPEGPALPAGRALLGTFLVPATCTFALSVVYAVMDTLAVGRAPDARVAAMVSQVGGIAAALVFFACFGRRRALSTSLVFNTVFGVLATGILFLPFFSGGYAVAFNTLVAAGWKLVMLALFYLVIETYTAHRARLLAGIALAYALPRLGLFVGLAVARLGGVGAGADFMRTVAIAFFCLYLVLMVIWFVNAHERKEALRAARAASEFAGLVSRGQADVRRARSDALARERGLTEREADVLHLIAEGRDTDYICAQCHLSKNTVKSYRKAIYAKLGVHSRQEVIDLVACDR